LHGEKGKVAEVGKRFGSDGIEREIARLMKGVGKTNLGKERVGRPCICGIWASFLSREQLRLCVHACTLSDKLTGSNG
jgi:hypothetical protein